MGKVFVVCDIGFGDGGKGTTVDVLTASFGIKDIVRHGGPQAAHNVVNSDGLRHCFAQFGSGMLQNDIRTYLSEKMLVAPSALLNEYEMLKLKVSQDPLTRTFFSPKSIVVTPWHIMVGQILEIMRGNQRHGSCGMGVGQTIYDSEKGLYLTISEMLDRNILKNKLKNIFEIKKDEALRLIEDTHNKEAEDRFDYFLSQRSLEAVFEEYLLFAEKISGQTIYFSDFVSINSKGVIFEGSQGALLDRRFGFYPNITKSIVTHHNASLMFNSISSQDKIHKLGIMRAYGHRHGTGLFPTENAWLSRRIQDVYNPSNIWQGNFRIGWLDLTLLRYGIDVNDGIDSIVITCLDQLDGLISLKICDGYVYKGNITPEIYRYFDTEPGPSGLIRINAIKKSMENREFVGKIIAQCQPIYKIMPGWSMAKNRKGQLHKNLLKFLNFIESKDGLGVPISIISLGPRNIDKILF